MERTRSNDALLGLSLCAALFELASGLWRAKEILSDLGGKSRPQAGHPNLPISEGFFHFTLLSLQAIKRKGREGLKEVVRIFPQIIIAREKAGCLF